MEHATEGGQTHTRHDFSANITQQDLVDSYLLPFQACVEKGEVSGLMCSYNSINGVPSVRDTLASIEHLFECTCQVCMFVKFWLSVGAPFVGLPFLLCPLVWYFFVLYQIQTVCQPVAAQ